MICLNHDFLHQSNVFVGALCCCNSVVIFTSFVKVAASVHKKLEESGWSGELLTGETPAKKRQTMVDNFQGGLSPVFVCTFGAGGVGLTLTASRTVILLDRPWTPGDAAQAEDRVRRIGQKYPVKSIWISAFDVDRQIDQMLESKTQTSNTVLNTAGKDKTNGLPAAAPKVSIFQLISKMLPEKPAHENGVMDAAWSQTSINAFYSRP
jgi:superfamily II DNA helicase RecQ